MALLCTLLTLYWLVLILAIVSSWFRVDPYGPMGGAVRVLRQLTEPVLRPVRAVLPPVRFGGGGLDLSPIVVFIGISVVQRIVC